MIYDSMGFVEKSPSRPIWLLMRLRPFHKNNIDFDRRKQHIQSTKLIYVVFKNFLNTSKNLTAVFVSEKMKSIKSWFLFIDHFFFLTVELVFRTFQ